MLPKPCGPLCIRLMPDDGEGRRRLAVLEDLEDDEDFVFLDVPADEQPAATRATATSQCLRRIEACLRLEPRAIQGS